MRLLSFLTAVEQSIGLDDPSPQGGKWDNTRMINYHQGLARLSLAALHGAVSVPLGTVLVQSFHLADGSTCLKTSLKWKDSTSEVVQAIYESSDTNWIAEARTVASTWLNGVVIPDTAPAENELSLSQTG